SDRDDTRRARDRAFDDGGDLLIDRFRRGIVILRADGDDRTVNARQFAHLDRHEGSDAGENDEKIEDNGKDRPAHEKRGDAAAAAGKEISDIHRIPPSPRSLSSARLTAPSDPSGGPEAAPAVAASDSPPTRVTAMPSRMRCSPSTTTSCPCSSSAAMMTVPLLRPRIWTGTRRAASPSRVQT